jgi:glycosyltransferase involved in cell wall biosynthesis
LLSSPSLFQKAVVKFPLIDWRKVAMRVLVDGFNLALEMGTGVATYARNLTYCLHQADREVAVLYGMRQAPDKTPLMKEIGYFDDAYAGARAQGRFSRLAAALNPKSRKAYAIEFTGAVIYRELASKLPYYDVLWNSPHLFDIASSHFHIYKRRLAVQTPGAVDIAHWTYPLPVKHKSAKNIYTLHDLVPLRLPYTTLDNKRYYYRLVKTVANQADHIVTVSENSRRDIINLLGVAEEKVSTTYQSVSIPSKYLELGEDILKDVLKGSFRLDYKGYLLFFGAIEPKKNVSRIIEAHLAANIKMPLVVVGAKSWKAEREQQLLKAYAGDSMSASTSRGRRILHLDYVSFQNLITLIRGARAVVFPSLYEGFGLPILEGMLCETPVITSNIGSMQEIADDACVLVDPYNTHEIKDAIIAVAANEDLCAQKAARGKIVANRYSPEAHQQRLEKVYSIVSEAGRSSVSRKAPVGKRLETAA